MEIFMNIKYKKILSVMLCFTLIFTLSACSQNTDSQKFVVPTENSNSAESESPLNMSIKLSDLITYDEDDYYTNYQDENPNYIKLNGTEISFEGNGAIVDNGTITINQAGTYVVSGKLDDGQIIVNESNDGVVKLILNNADINCSYSSPIYVINSNKTVISLVEGTENTVTDGITYTNVDETTSEPNSAIFSKSNLTITGSGTLNVNGNYNNGITSKDDLKITDGNINIISTDDGLMGRDMVAVKSGNIKINSIGHGIKSTNDEDTTKGYIVLENGIYNITSGADSIHAQTSLYIVDGEYTLTSDDDGIHADTSIEIASGNIDITKSYEGIESSEITISGGEINIIASDDGINVAGGNDGSAINGRPDQSTFSENDNSKLNINGGIILVNAEGDGLDSNGSIYMTKGNVTVLGPISNGNGALDYDGEFNITGGTLISAGSSGMAQGPSDSSTQNSVVIKYSVIQNAGTPVIIKNAAGNTIFTFAPTKEFQTVVLSSPDLLINETYSLYSDDLNSADFTLTENSTWISETGEAVSKGGGFGGTKGGGMRPDKPQGEFPKVEGQTPPDGTSSSTPSSTGEDI
jgi:hypothetical protein